jgi:hypothetical protein
MNCKEAIKDYKIAKSQEQGLNHKLAKLDSLIEQGNLDLLDRLLLESQTAREQLTKIDHSIKILEDNYKFLNKNKPEVTNE